MDQNLEQEADAGQDNINNNMNNNNDDVIAAEFIEFWRQQFEPDFNQDNLNDLLQQFGVNNVNEFMQLHPFFNNLDEEDNEDQEDVDNEDSDSDDSGNEEVDINNDVDSDDESEG